jgi:hypothetical protein
LPWNYLIYNIYYNINCLEQIERDLVKEGEKLSDMLSMPVKNAMGVVLNVDYEADIVNVSEILEMTKARCQLFCDSVELQRLTLQQVSYVLNYETDASQVSSIGIAYITKMVFLNYILKLIIIYFR